MPSGPKRRKAAKKKKHQQHTPILQSSPTIQGTVSQNRSKLDPLSAAFGAVVSVNCAHMEEESANHKLEDFLKEEVQLDDGVHETENSEHVKEIDIGDDLSSGGSSSSEEETKLEEKSSEFVEEEKEEEVSESFVALVEETEDLLEAAVENPVENLVISDLPVMKSEKTEEKLSESLDDCNGISSIEAEIVSNGTKETELAATEEKNEESAGVVNFVSEGKIDDFLQEAVEPRAIDSQIPESTAYQATAVDTSNVGEHQNEPEIPESTGYQPPIIPVTQRAMHPTSWRSCCGLFDVLRRSDR